MQPSPLPAIPGYVVTGKQSPVSPDFARHAVRVEGLQDTYDAGDTVSFTLPALDLTSLGSPRNTTVAVTATAGDETYDLGDVPVSGGVAVKASPSRRCKCCGWWRA